MRPNSIVLYSVCYALLCGNVLANAGDEPKTTKKTSFIEKIKDTQRISSERYKKSRELASDWFKAAKSGKLEDMKSIYKNPFFDNAQGFKFDIFVEDDLGRTALEVAIENGHCNIVKWLDTLICEWERAERGHRFNLRSENTEGTPMMIVAVKNGHEDIVKYMLSKVMDPNIVTDKKNMSRKTPLIVAAEKGFINIANLLLTNPYSCKADPNLKDGYKETALIVAAREENVDIVKLLLKYGADTEVKNYVKKTALMYAVEKGNLDISQLLLDHGAKINRTDKNNKTVVDYAKGNKEMTELLMKYIDRPENQKKVNVIKQTWNKFTKKTGDPRRTMSDSNLIQYDTDKTSSLTRSQSDSNIPQYDDDTMETSNLKKNELTDSTANFYDNDLNPSTNTIVAQ